MLLGGFKVKTCLIGFSLVFGALRFAAGSWLLHVTLGNALQYLQLGQRVVKRFSTQVTFYVLEYK